MPNHIIVLILLLWSSLLYAQTKPVHDLKTEENPSNAHIKSYCIENIQPSLSSTPPTQLSAFRTFNQYPPVPSMSRPDTVSFSDIRFIDQNGDCFERPPIYFNVLEHDGHLREGKSDDLKMYKLWKTDKGPNAVYMYRKYETHDGEGEAIVFALVRYDWLGRITSYIEEASSWYEYEGAIRLRDSLISDGSWRLLETIYDVEELDEQGNPIKYVKSQPAVMLEAKSITY